LVFTVEAGDYAVVNNYEPVDELETVTVNVPV
jgi:hypothetical protein